MDGGATKLSLILLCTEFTISKCL